MKSVQKFSFVPVIDGPNLVAMPRGAQFLTARGTQSEIALFALVDDMRPVVEREIFAVLNHSPVTDVPDAAFFFRSIVVPDGHGNGIDVHLFALSEIPEIVERPLGADAIEVGA